MSREPRRFPSCARCHGWGRFSCGKCARWALHLKPHCHICEGVGKVPCPSCKGASPTELADEIMEEVRG